MKTDETPEQPATAKTEPVVHTPGPWMHELELDHTGQETLEVMEVNGHQMRIVSWDKSCISHTDIANALLIAAAPELLDALEQALQWIEVDETTHGRKFGAGNVARDAIAKATGRSVV